MLNATHEKRIKIRYIRSVTKLPHIIEYRIAFIKWSKFVAKEQMLDEKVNSGWNYFKQKRLAISLNKLVEHYMTRKQIREGKMNCFNLILYRNPRMQAKAI